MFLISGLWHGSAWTYIIFGALQGIFLIIPLIFSGFLKKISQFKMVKLFPKTYKAINILLAFSLFSLSLSVFRSLSLTNAITIWNKIIHISGPIYIGEMQQFIYCFFAIVFLLIIEFRREYFGHSQLPFITNHWFKEQLAYAIIIVLILMVGVFDGSQFIYFQF